MASVPPSSDMDAPAPVCNGYTELCSRPYGNYTMVGCHNSPFLMPNSVAANQELDVVDQLNDGIRFLQAQIQWPGTGAEDPHFCHTSCAIHDSGPIGDWLGLVKEWLDRHPREVVTILLGNGDYSPAERYVPFIEATGIVPHLYVPATRPRQVGDWPTLGEIIDSGHRALLFLDYKADEARFPWLLDQFAYMWETPMDPAIDTLDCSVQRPPALADDDARQRLALLNHNVNLPVELFGISALMPAEIIANQSNAASGHGSLGEAAANCVGQWGRAPNVLNVDFYNRGMPPGSVFEVAAALNGLPYVNTCCGNVDEYEGDEEVAAARAEAEAEAERVRALERLPWPWRYPWRTPYGSELAARGIDGMSSVSSSRPPVRRPSRMATLSVLSLLAFTWLA